jgi:hypothetical protein
MATVLIIHPTKIVKINFAQKWVTSTPSWPTNITHREYIIHLP